MSAEWELIEKAKTGDKNALNEIVAECWQPLYRFISFKTGNPEEAQDIAQETFYRAFRTLGTYQKTDALFSTWIGRIATNLITDLWRKKGRSPIMNDISDHLNDFTGGENPAETIVNRETRDTLVTLLTELPGRTAPGNRASDPGRLTRSKRLPPPWKKAKPPSRCCSSAP